MLAPLARQAGIQQLHAVRGAVGPVVVGRAPARRRPVVPVDDQARRRVDLLRVRAGDTTVGCLYNFVSRGDVSFYQSGLAYETDGKLKPGLVCHALAIDHAARAGHRWYDFLAG